MFSGFSSAGRCFFSLLIVLLLIVLGVYSEVGGHSYVWDDSSLFIDTPALRSGENVLDSISKPILPSTTYFRPMVLLSFVAEFSLVGVNSSLSHWVNLFLHLGSVAFIGVLAYRLFRRSRANYRILASISAAAFYGLHPSLVEPVVWVAGRFDVMVTFFVLAACVAALYMKSTFWRALVVGLCFFCAALSKEMALVFPLFWFAFMWASLALRPKLSVAIAWGWRHRSLEVASILLAGLLYLYVRWQVNPGMLHVDSVMNDIYVGWSRLWLVASSLSLYLHLVIWPFSDLNPMHPTILYYTNSAIVTGTLALAVTLLLVFWSCFARFKRATVFGVLAVLSLLPVLNLLPLTTGGNIGHERFLALPLVAFSLCFGAFLIQILSYQWTRYLRAACWIFGVGWMLLAVVNVVVTIPLWKSDTTLWTWAYKRYPCNTYVQYSLISAVARAGHLQYGEQLLEDMKISDKSCKSLDYRRGVAEGLLLLRLNRAEEGVVTLEKVEERNPPLPHELFLSEGGSLEGYSVDPRSQIPTWFYRSLYGALAEAYLALGEYDVARKNISIALFYQPDYPPLYVVKGLAFLGEDDAPNALDALLYSQSIIIPSAKSEPLTLVRQFLPQVCRRDDAPQKVCADKSEIYRALGERL